MARIAPLKGLRFDPKVAGPPDAVWTPPYDVISEEERRLLAESSPFNMTHLILPVPEGSRTAADGAADRFKRWRDMGVLRGDSQPAIYLLRQTFHDPTGRIRVRRSFLARLKLPEAGERCVLGHERTFDKPVEERLALMRATEAQLEPIFILYSDPDGAVENLFAIMDREHPLQSAQTMDGVRQELWKSPCPEFIEAHLAGQVLYIADGHHRFKTACLYRDEQRAGLGRPANWMPCDYVLAGFVSFEEPGLQIYAAHRVLPEVPDWTAEAVLKRLEPWFDLDSIGESDDPYAALGKGHDGVMIMCIRGTGSFLISLKNVPRPALLGDDRGPAWQSLDVAVLHRGILDRLLQIRDDLPIHYEKDAREAQRKVQSGEAAMAFLLRPTRPDQVRACAEALEPMPHKSTYFFPKLVSGAVIHPFR